MNLCPACDLPVDQCRCPPLSALMPPTTTPTTYEPPPPDAPAHGRLRMPSALPPPKLFVVTEGKNPFDIQVFARRQDALAFKAKLWKEKRTPTRLFVYLRTGDKER